MINFEDVQVKYGNTVIIDHLDLQINTGEFFTFLGASGCGKTTTLRALAGFLTPSRGDILVDGKSIVNVPVEKRGIGVIFQNYALFPSMTVYENIAFGLKVKKMKKQDIREAVNKVADMVELSQEQLGKNIARLSGGQQQRVAIARALVNNPEILLLDEPLSNLDAKLRKQLRTELKKMQKNFGITSIYVTHDQDEALTLSDRIAVFNKGKIEQVGTPDELYNKAETEYVCNFIGDVSKLSGEVIRLINEELGETRFHPDAASYIRQERIETDRLSPDAVAMEAKVLEREFYGTHSIYTYGILDSTIKGYVKECGGMPYQPGEVIRVYINPRDILQY